MDDQIELRGELICVHAWGCASSGGARKKITLWVQAFQHQQKIDSSASVNFHYNNHGNDKVQRKKKSMATTPAMVMITLIGIHDGIVTYQLEHDSFNISNETMVQKIITYSFSHIRLDILHCGKCSHYRYRGDR
jgi:hypothetical protein